MGEKGPTRKKIAQDETKYETSIVPIGFLCEREREMYLIPLAFPNADALGNISPCLLPLNGRKQIRKTTLFVPGQNN